MISSPISPEFISRSGCSIRRASTSSAIFSSSATLTGLFWVALRRPLRILLRSKGSRRPSFFTTMSWTSSMRSYVVNRRLQFRHSRRRRIAAPSRASRESTTFSSTCPPKGHFIRAAPPCHALTVRLSSRAKPFGVQGKLLAELPDLVPHPLLAGLVGRILEDLGDELADEAHLLLAHPPGGHRRRPDADAAGHRRFLRIKRNGILVYRDPGLLQRRLGHLAGQPLGPEIHQHQMGIRPSRDQAKAESAKLPGPRDRVQLNLALVRAELVTQGLLEGDRLGGDDVHQGAALEAGKEVLVEDRRVLLLTHDQPPPGDPERLVGGGGDDLVVGDRRGVQFRGDEAGGGGGVGPRSRSDRP